MDSIYCRQSCRQAAHRFRQGCVARAQAELPIRLAYADPPYPGKAFYYRDHPDFAGEVDHCELLSRLQAFDGWALSTSAEALPDVLALAVAHDVEVRVGAWVRGHRPTRSRWPLSAWEPVVFAGGRRVPSRDAGVDALVYHSRPRLTDPARVIGAKPARFCYWLFDLLGAQPSDELVDLFPGSGGVARAWDVFTAAGLDASPRDLRDTSFQGPSDASLVDRGDASARPRADASRGAAAHGLQWAVTKLGLAGRCSSDSRPKSQIGETPGSHKVGP